MPKDTTAHIGVAHARAIVVLSGGLDSTTALALAINEFDHYSVRTLFFHYGQRHDLIESDAASKVADHYRVEHSEVDVRLGVGGALMDHSVRVPQVAYSELPEGPSPSYVPFRNGTFLSLAASYAQAMGAQWIYAGMHAEDAHNWAYPDCTPEFIGAMQNAIYIGTYHAVRLVVPFQYMDKANIVNYGTKIGVPYSLTRSCYEGHDPACGRCSTCLARLEAFRVNGLKDPLRYEFDKYRMDEFRTPLA